MAQPHDPQTHEEVVPVPKEGDLAPTLGSDIHFPSDKPVLVVFLRHCGDPFAEKTFRLLTNLSNHHPEVHCVAVSQSSQDETDKWYVCPLQSSPTLSEPKKDPSESKKERCCFVDNKPGSSRPAASGTSRSSSTPSASCITPGGWG